MRRRALFASMAVAALSSGRLRAQQKAMPVIGILDSTSLTPGEAPWETAFSQGLAESGYMVGQSLTVLRREAEGHFERLPALAADLVSRKVDVIRTGSLPGTNAAKGASATIP